MLKQNKRLGIYPAPPGKPEPDSEIMANCKTCGIEKPLNHFYKRPDRPGHYTTCRECKKIRERNIRINRQPKFTDEHYKNFILF